MQLAILTVVLAAIASAEWGGEPLAGLLWRLPLTLCAALAAPLAALVATQRLPSPLDAEANENSLARRHTMVIGIWLSSMALLLLVIQWPRLVRTNWQLGQWPLIDELTILLPIVVSLLLVWAALYHLERTLQLAACQIRNVAPPPARLFSHLWLQVRHQLALVLLPPIAVVAVVELCGYFKVAALQADAAWWLAAPLVATTLVFMPFAVCRIFRTASLDSGELRGLLDDVCCERRCRVRDILIWETDRTIANAAVVGLSRWLRYVLITDVLIARLYPKELAAVLRHELGHLRRWHLPLRMALLLVPVVWWLAIVHLWPTAQSPVKDVAVVAHSPWSLAASLILPLGMLAYTVIVVGWYSRLLEHDADLDGCLTQDGTFNPAASADFCSALFALCGRSHRRSWTEWSHPSVGSRIDFLHRAESDFSHARRFRRRLWLLNAAIVASYATAAATLAWR